MYLFPSKVFPYNSRGRGPYRLPVHGEACDRFRCLRTYIETTSLAQMAY